MCTRFSYSFAGISSKSCIIAYYYIELVYHDCSLIGPFLRVFVCPFNPKSLFCNSYISERHASIMQEKLKYAYDKVNIDTDFDPY